MPHTPSRRLALGIIAMFGLAAPVPLAAQAPDRPHGRPRVIPPCLERPIPARPVTRDPRPIPSASHPGSP